VLALKFWNGREASPYFWDLGEGERMRTDIRVSAMAYTSSLLVAESGRQVSLFNQRKEERDMRQAEGVEEIDHIHERKWHIVGDSSKSFLRRNTYSLPFPSTIGCTHDSVLLALVF